MRQVFELLRTESRARLFFLALTQSAIGTGAGYVALVLIAYERYESAWAITLVLLADLLPAMLLGPVFGAAADRWSRRGCMVVSDVLRAIAFIGISLVDSYLATVALALLLTATVRKSSASSASLTLAMVELADGLPTVRVTPAAALIVGAVFGAGGGQVPRRTDRLSVPLLAAAKSAR